MRLRLENCNDLDFILYLIKFIRTYVRNSIRANKLYYLDEYIEEDLQISIKSKIIILLGLQCLKYNRFTFGTYEIYIDKNRKLPGYDAKIYDLCRLINYGNLHIQGYPIFSKAFEYVEEHLDLLYFKYARGF